jgi:hypothetical protein
VIVNPKTVRKIMRLHGLHGLPGLPRRMLGAGLAGGHLRRSGRVRISSYFRTL